MDLESESIMDISALSMNLNPTEVTREEHFGLSASNFSVNVSKTTSWMDVLEESIKGLPDTKILAEKQQKRIRGNIYVGHYDISINFSQTFKDTSYSLSKWYWLHLLILFYSSVTSFTILIK